MTDETSDIVIVFNGEIYNYKDLRKELISVGYKFRTESDTEVLINAYKCWGEFCTKKLNGMFSFALLDKRKNHLFLSRDRAGEKPLFYSLYENKFRFSSELKGILKDPSFDASVNRIAVDCYLTIGSVPGDLSIFKHVKKLKSGHSLLLDLNTFSEPLIWEYWKLPTLDEQSQSSDDELLNELEGLLEDSVRLQLLSADVPVGILLSGGIDSSLVTAMASRISKNVKTFTITFPGHKKFDESKYAEIVANHFGTDHIKLSGSEVSIQDFKDLSMQFDEPMADSSSIPTYLVSKLIREHCTVALGGDGGDELFGGYPYYSRLKHLKGRLDKFPEMMRYFVAKTSASLLPIGFRGRNWAKELDSDLETELPMTSSFFDKTEREKLFGYPKEWFYAAESIQRKSIPVISDLVDRATRYDFANYMCNDILVKVDRSSMMNSLEVRAPFLDYRIIDFAFGKVPSSLKANQQDKKILLKKLCKKVLPAELDFNRKQGFSIPLASWLTEKGEWKDFFHDILLDNNDSLFDKKYVESLLRGQANGRNNSERIFSLVVFELWRKNYNVNNI
jgi:asparagine synthase (glutamine-hydrolysing)